MGGQQARLPLLRLGSVHDVDVRTAKSLLGVLKFSSLSRTRVGRLTELEHELRASKMASAEASALHAFHVYSSLMPSRKPDVALAAISRKIPAVKPSIEAVVTPKLHGCNFQASYHVSWKARIFDRCELWLHRAYVGVFFRAASRRAAFWPQKGLRRRR